MASDRTGDRTGVPPGDPPGDAAGGIAGGPESVARRLDAVEMALSHAEAAIEDLSDIARDQQAEIATLRRDLARLTRAVEDLDMDADAPQPHQQTPPHY